MTTEDPDLHGEARQPRSVVKVNGERLDAVSWRVECNALHQADTFSVTFALSAMPAGKDRAWWASEGKIEVEIFAGFPADVDQFDESELKSLIVGRIDDVDLNPGTRSVQVSGRDYTADLIDTKTSEKFPENRASDIVSKIAARHGLTPNVEATTTKVGSYYKRDHVRLQDNSTEWELLTWLAREEGFTVFVRGKELHFKPKPEDAKPRVFKWVDPTSTEGSPKFEATDLNFSRSLTLAKDVKVTVRSWNSKAKKAYTKTAKRTHPKGSGELQEFSYVIPNLTPEQAQQRANKLLAELSQHEMKVEIAGPADNDLTISDRIEIRGTGTAFDQVYYPESITLSMSDREGYGWQIAAKNHSADSEEQL